MKEHEIQKILNMQYYNRIANTTKKGIKILIPTWITTKILILIIIYIKYKEILPETIIITLIEIPIIYYKTLDLIAKAELIEIQDNIDLTLQKIITSLKK